VAGSFWTSHEIQYNDRRTMGGIEEEEEWFFDMLRMGRIGGKGTVCHIAVLSATYLTRSD